MILCHDDRIAKIDQQVGLIQTIQCDRSSQAIQNSCHAMESTICHLLRHCGDVNGRFATCKHDFELMSLLPTLTTLGRTNAWLLLSSAAFVLIMVLLAIIPEVF
jgi:hypothetical protein